MSGISFDIDLDKKAEIITDESGLLTEIEINSQTAFTNGKTITLTAPAEIKNSRTMVPLRFVSDAFGAEVNRESETKTAKINTAG